jgi:hypothetical protein
MIYAYVMVIGKPGESLQRWRPTPRWRSEHHNPAGGYRSQADVDRPDLGRRKVTRPGRERLSATEAGSWQISLGPAMP